MHMVKNSGCILGYPADAVDSGNNSADFISKGWQKWCC